MAKFYQNIGKCQNWYLHGIILPKVENAWAKNLQKSYVFNDNEELSKVWKGIDLPSKNWHKQFDKFWIEHWKASKICTLTGCFWLKCIINELKKYRRVTFYDARKWFKIWKKSYLWFGKWHEEFDEFSPEHTEVSKLKLLFGLFIQKQKMYELEIYKVVMCYDIEEWYKIWKGIDLSFQNWNEKFDKFWTVHSWLTVQPRLNEALINYVWRKSHFKNY